MKNTLLFIYSLFIFHFSFSQDIHFSQFYDNPVIINPANTGNFSGNWRFISNFRNQTNSVNSPYKTTTLTFEHPVYYYTEKASVGLIYINDFASDNTLITNKIYLSTAYFRKISRKSYLHLGFQFGYVHKKYSMENLSFPDQFDMGTGLFNPNSQTSEYLENQKKSYLDLNWGLMWSRVTDILKIETGISMFHYNLPNESFFENSQNLPVKFNLHGYLIYTFENDIFLSPKMLYSIQKKASELLIGSDIGYNFENNTKVFAGTYFRGGFFRNSDAFIARFGLLYKNFEYSFNYDLELYSKRNNSFSKTAFELVIKYIRPLTEIKKTTIPCEIF